MKPSLPWLGALLVLGGLAVGAQANPYFPGCSPNPTAPDACGPGYYVANPCGVYGPNYNVYPPFPPHNGPMYTPPVPVSQCPVPGGQFPTHPYARSPRDFFMVPTP